MTPNSRLTGLNVKDGDEAEVAALGALRNIADGRWLLPPGVDRSLFGRWLSPVSAATHESLSELLARLGDAVKRSAPGGWIRCEIASMQRRAKGYWMLGLQDCAETGQKVSSVDAVVWSQDVNAVIGKFRRGTAEDLAPGMKVLLFAEADLSALWGLRLIVRDVDPAWTIGLAERALREVRVKLQAEGLWGRNKLLPVPVDFTSVAVVSPAGSAGLGDFMAEARKVESWGVCRFDIFEAVFEGPNAAASLSSSLTALHPHSGRYDAICVVRGGGAASGLAWVNHESVVRAACSCPIPIITGIGHERDRTLLDEVANQSRDTPSKVIGHIISTMAGSARHAAQDWCNFRSLVQQRLGDAQRDVDQMRVQSVRLSAALLDRSQSMIDALFREAIGLGPSSVMARGYAVASTSDGRPIATSEDAMSAADIVLTFRDGRVAAIIRELRS